jgi:hypothetical protein
LCVQSSAINKKENAPDVTAAAGAVQVYQPLTQNKELTAGAQVKPLRFGGLRKNVMSISFIFGILGIIGGLLCAAGDILFDLKGSDNIKSGPSGMIDSNWLKMSEWRFRASIAAAALGAPLCVLGYLGMSRQLSLNSPALGTTFLIFAVIGSCGGFFIHAILCCNPIIRKTLTKSGVEDSAQFELFTKLFSAIIVPFIIMFCSLVILTSFIVIYAIITGYLIVPFVFVLLNPPGLMLIGWLFRLINKRLFCDLPGIIMPSVGIAMIGLMTAISAYYNG